MQQVGFKTTVFNLCINSQFSTPNSQYRPREVHKGLVIKPYDQPTNNGKQKDVSNNK